jgi:hypothetical protein
VPLGSRGWLEGLVDLESVGYQYLKSGSGERGRDL